MATLKRPTNAQQKQTEQRQLDLGGLPFMLNVEEVSKLLRISRASTYNLLATEGFPRVVVGKKRVVVPRDKLAQWIEQQNN